MTRNDKVTLDEVLLVNFEKYDSQHDNWKSIEELIGAYDFLDLLFVKFRGDEASKDEKDLLLKTLLTVSMGTGDEPPSVFVPKTIASVTKSRDFAVINGLIGGLATFGTHHLGAVCENMKLLDDLGDNGVKMWVDEKLSHGMKLCGFGHPVYKKDRRPDILYASIEEVYPDHKMLIRYNALRDELHSRKGIHPNIDAVVGLAYSCMNFEPEQGIYLSFLARSLSMMSHILEEFPGKPFDFFLKKSKRER